MTTSNRDHLAHLRRDAAQSLRTLARSAALPAAVPGRLGPQHSAHSGPLSPAATTINVNLTGGPIFLDDERRIRALAKQIKRLLTEDQRRGIGIGD
jgi:hypothetical protein